MDEVDATAARGLFDFQSGDGTVECCHCSYIHIGSNIQSVC